VTAFLKRSGGDVAAGEESACLFAFFLHRLLKINGKTQKMPAVSDGTYSLLSRTMEYILLHLDHRVTLKELEQALHVSGSTIRQKFRKYMDCSIGNYQRRRRLILACEMLQNSNLSIAEIAAKVGFATPEGMRRALLTEAGCSAKSIRDAGETLQNFTMPFKDKLR
jgi:AraC-like DNA-binding protein